MKVFITGGTGFVGALLVNRLSGRGDAVSVLTRSSREDPAGMNVTFIQGDPTLPGKWQEKVPEHDVIINLAGASIFSRWTKKRKKRIRDSRLLTTQNLVDALAVQKDKEPLLLNASAVGFYGFHEDARLDEAGAPGDDFLGSLSQEWECAALGARKNGVRVVRCRFGIVLGSDGGALAKMALPIRYYVGSPMGSGRQWLSWIHEKDLIEIFLFLMNRRGIAGPVNCTAPHPVRNREMIQVLAKTLRRPLWLPSVPAWVMKLVFGEFATSLVKGQRVLPARLLDSGFRFRFPHIREALNDLLSKKE